MNFGNEINLDAKLTTFEKACLGALALWPLLFILAVSALFGGCANSPSGVKVVASSASYTNIGDINWDEYKIPVLSLYLGPKATVWVNKNYKCLDEIEVCGTVTNTTSALAIYNSHENKTLVMRLKFNDGVATNVTATATD